MTKNWRAKLGMPSAIAESAEVTKRTAALRELEGRVADMGDYDLEDELSFLRVEHNLSDEDVEWLRQRAP